MPRQFRCALEKSANRGDPCEVFFGTFRNRPDAFLRFAQDELGIRLWPRQEEIFFSVFQNPETYVRTGNATGKTFAAGFIGCAFLVCKIPSKVIFLATKLAQAKRQTWAEFLRAYGKLRARLAEQKPPIILPEPLAESVGFTQDWFATVWAGAEADPEAFHGFHGRNLLFVIDEAGGVGNGVREAADRCLTERDNHLLAAGNPRKKLGWFHDDQMDPVAHRKVIHISALESPNIAGVDHIPGLATQEWINRVKAEYGLDSPFYQTAVLGEFPQESEDALIPWSAIVEAAERHGEAIPDVERLAIGVDVARFGNDSSVICVLAGDVAVELLELRKHDTMSVAGWVLETMKRYNARAVAIDEAGLGGGPVDRLREMGIDVRAFRAGSSARDKDKSKNLKAEAAWSLRERFVEGRITIPEHERLQPELAAWRYDFDSSGRRMVIDPPKSPDFADALLIAHWMQGQGSRSPDEVLLPAYRAEEWALNGY